MLVALKNTIKILIVSPFPAQQFVLNDMAVLGKQYEVELSQGLRRGGLKRLVTRIKANDFVLCWFGCRTSAVAVFLSRLFGKKVAVIAGGQDVAHVPEIALGLMGKWSHRGFVRFAFNHCDAVLAVSRCSAGDLMRWATPKALCLVYNGVDIPEQVPLLSNKTGVACVARITENSLALKGIKSLLKAATLLPQVPFTLIGEVSRGAYTIISPLLGENVRLTGWVDHASVKKLLLQSRVYVQPSYYESFGVALAEAMAAGCTPVVTRSGAMPEVVGETGFYVPYGSEIRLADSIAEALLSDMGREARQRVMEYYSLKKRADRLMRLFESLFYTGTIPDELLL